ncbi:MAG: TonB-dependent receptor [Marinoscillum sp.]
MWSIQISGYNIFAILKGRKSLAAIVLALICSTVHAQDRRIAGTVTDEENGESIPGATILIKGTSNGTITDMDGNYSIQAGEGDVLLISFVGYQSQEETVGNRSEINVSLSVDIASLDEVVVVGYGTQRKKVVTAATSQVKGDELMKRNITRPMQALQGQVAGVSIRSSSGQPGAGMNVIIRGQGTIGNSGPLYIVDGIATGDISYLNNSDIESVDVLKDAASAAIYGSRAANGVILITTKSGKEGKSQITLDSYYGVQNVPKKTQLLDAEEYAQIMNEQHLNSGGTIGGLPFDINNLPTYKESGSADTKWLDEMFTDNAVTQNYSIGLTGGSKQNIYSMGFSYTGQEGIVGGKSLSNYERYNGRINSESKHFNDKLKIGENFTFTYSKRNGVSDGNQYFNTLRGAFNVSPLRPVYDDYGNFFNASDTITDQNGDTYWNPTEGHPYGSMVLTNQNESSDQKLLGKVYAELEPMKGLKLHTSFGVDLYNSENRSLNPEYELSDYAVNTINSVNQSMNRSRAFQFDNFGTYDFNLGDNNFNVLVGMSSRDFQGSFISGSNAELVFPVFDKAWLTNATNEESNLIQLSGAPYDRDKLLSYFGRLGYTFKDKYLFNATFRADGSSRFAKGNRWGYFPSVSAGWVVSDEQFLSSASFLDFLKIRASWGQNGSQAVGAFQYLAPISFTQATYIFGNEEGVNTPGAYPSRLSNEDLKWETSEQIDIGVDMRLLAGKLSTSIDWYKKSTIDWIITPPILATAGAGAPAINGGRVENTGFELELSFRDNVGSLNWSITANGNYNQNVVKEIPTEDGIIHGQSNQLYANSPEFYQARTGFPIGYFWGLESDGLFQNAEEVQAHTNSSGTLIQRNAKPGDVRFVDRNDDGLLNDQDKIQLGNPNPPVTLGLSAAVNYRGFDLSIMGFGSFGHQLVQSYRDHTGKFSNYTTAILDRWTGEGTSNTIPRVTNGNVNYIYFSDLFIQDGDFFRIGNITLGYDLGKLIRSESISQMRVYLAVNNVMTFTRYTGMDPDIGYNIGFSSGIDLGFYPNPRTALAGVSFKF